MKIIGISGSLRRGSYNSKLLHCARSLFPENVSLNIVDIGGIPLYNGDLDTIDKPQAVAGLLDLLAAVFG